MVTVRFMRPALILPLLMGLCAGCPEAPIKSRIVSLDLSHPHSAKAVALSVKDNEVREAVQVVGDTLVADGFVRDSNPPEASIQGFVTSYSKFDAEGRVTRRPLVWFENNRLQVVFVEGRAGVRADPEETKLIHEIQQQLIDRYGKESVRVERKSI